ncbi:MAG: hypothetical protein JO332_01315 [Planctomycetaceae bacterium]|nr:hypothetical protein [Planctomycetaceae bacterium]
MPKILHIAGVVCGFVAAAIMIVVGIVYATQHAAPPVAGGKLISFGLGCLGGCIFATIDGARALPQLGLWRIGAKWEGLGDLAVLLITVSVGLGIGVSFAFH